jgi:tRNA nucleotidyltransferase/poly(A) polymerase
MRVRETVPFQAELPPAAEPAVTAVHKLAADGHQALLAGGCVRDLLLGLAPQDYDIATDATPDRICELFRRTRKVGAQFGVVLVRVKGRWVEVATFRSDGEYLDGRRPVQVHFCDARHDAERRDFTVNGMFLDPLERTLIDYVGGRQDLQAGLIRAIGDPAARFAEDHLRLLRAVRFAGRLGFEIEPATFAALKANVSKLVTVAA